MPYQRTPVSRRLVDRTSRTTNMAVGRMLDDGSQKALGDIDEDEDEGKGDDGDEVL